VPKAAVDHQIRADKDGAVALARGRRRSRAVRFGPGHNLQVEDVHVVEEIRSVPSAEDDHLCATDQVCGVIEARNRSTTTLGALIPGHRDWVKSVKITVDSILGALASKNNYSGAGKDSCVGVPGRRWRTADLGFEPPA